MQTIYVKENSSIILTEELKADFDTVGMANFPLLEITESRITLPNFTVGEIRLENHTIQIEPLNQALKLENIFEMYAYSENVNNTNILNSSHNSTSSSTGFNDFIEDFLYSIKNTVSFGISNVYTNKRSWQTKVKGTIDASKFNKKIIAYKGVYSKNTEYTRDSMSNRLLLKALHLVKELHGDSFDDSLFQYFESVSEYKGTISSKDETIAVGEYSSNPHHSLSLAYALMIIKDLSIGYSTSGSIKWHSFLVNSNQIYEKYLRTILSNGIQSNVQKISKPIAFARNSTNPNDSKFVEPDILINYNPSNSTAQMILDAKNKKISITKPLSTVSTGDLYQIAYYAQIFKAKSAGLIYPTTAKFEPVRINIHTESPAKYYLIGINMSESIERRHEVFVKQIADILRISG